MRSFKQNDYYHPDQDQSIVEGDNSAIEPTVAGMNLICEYYKYKYNTDISVIDMRASISYFPMVSFLMKILTDHLDLLETNFQKAYIFVSSTHSYLCLLLRKDNVDAVVFADSLNAGDTQKRASSMIHQVTEGAVKVFLLNATRQADRVSCHVDALVLGREATARNASGVYKNKELFHFFEDHSHNVDGVLHIDKLPNALLQTTQISKVVDTYRTQDVAVHKEEQLNDFLNRHAASVMLHDKKSKKVISNYLRTKGLDMAKVMEMQFYANEIKHELKGDWTKEQQAEFYRRAKLFIRHPVAGKSLHTLAEDYLAEVKTPKPAP